MSEKEAVPTHLARAVLAAELKRILTQHWSGVMLTRLPDMLRSINWRAHYSTVTKLLAAFPDVAAWWSPHDLPTVRYAVLPVPLLLPAVKSAVEAAIGQAGLATFAQLGEYFLKQKPPVDLELVGHMADGRSPLQLLQDAGVVCVPTDAGVFLREVQNPQPYAESTTPAQPPPKASSAHPQVPQLAVPSVNAATKAKKKKKSKKNKVAPSVSPSVAQPAPATASAAREAPQPAPPSATSTGSSQNIVIVEDEGHCREVVQILALDQPLALDCEGRLDDAKGGLCLLQIATSKGECFLFDVREGGDALFHEGGLRHVLEDVHILKVGHDLRGDARALLQQHNVYLNHVFDTQVGHALITNGKQRQSGLNVILEQYANATNAIKDVVKQTWKTDRGYWLKRPLTPDMIEYAAEDVRHLLSAHDKMAQLLRQHKLYEHAIAASRVYADALRLRPGKALDSDASDAMTNALEYEEEVERVVATNCFVRKDDEGVDMILDCLPERYGLALGQDSRLWGLVEIVMDLGRPPMARFSGKGLPRVAQIFNDGVTVNDLQQVCDSITTFDSENRAGMSETLHRISRLRNRSGEVVGLTIRVGKTIHGLTGMVADVLQEAASKKASILLLGSPGMGKTSAIREMARILAEEWSVMIVDTSNEIAGDGDVPHPAIGLARRMQVQTASEQHKRMIEAVQNHTPDVIIVDEIGTADEAKACCTIARRGVMLVATAHGVTLKDVVDNPSLNTIVGGVEAVILSDMAVRDRGLQQKTVRESKGPSAFGVAIELKSRTEWIVHHDVRANVGLMLNDKPIPVEVRRREDDGRVVATKRLVKATSGLEGQIVEV